MRRANRFGERPHQPFETIAIFARKARDSRTIAIKDADNRAAHNERHDYFRARRGVADDVIGETSDVVDDLRFTPFRGRAADAAPGGKPRRRPDGRQTGQEQIARRRQHIKSGPVDLGKLVIDEGGEVGRRRRQSRLLRPAARAFDARAVRNPFASGLVRIGL